MTHYSIVKMVVKVCDELPDDRGSWDGWAGRLNDPEDGVFMVSASGPMTFEEIKDLRFTYFDMYGGI